MFLVWLRKSKEVRVFGVKLVKERKRDRIRELMELGYVRLDFCNDLGFDLA